MAVKTRKPTGTPAWDLMLIAAAAKCGKSYNCAKASASDVIGRTFWIGFGEADPDEYGALVDEHGRHARFEIVDLAEYGGATYAGLMRAIAEVVAEPRTDGKPNLIVLDKASKVWDLLSDQADHAARVRDAKKKKLSYVPSAETVGDEVTIGNDLWNSATNRWLDMLDLLKRHDGPVILTANLKYVSVMKNGAPTKDKEWKIEGQKNFAADVSCVVEIPALREVYVTGVRSLRFEPVKTGEHTSDNRFPDFTIESLWATLGLTSETAKRDHATLIRPGSEADAMVAEEIATEVATAAAAPLDQRLAALQQVWQTYGPETLHSTQAIAPDGSQITAAALITGWANATRAALEPKQQETAPAAPTQEPVKADAHALLMDEIQGMAATMRVNPGEFVKPLIEKHEGASKVKDVPAAQVLAFVASERPRVIAALREQGESTAADAYSKVPDAVWATWEQLTSPRETTEQAAQPVNA